MQLHASLGCYQCSASGKAGVCSSSFGVHAGAPRAGPACVGFLLLTHRQLLCDHYARVGRCAFVPANSGNLPLLCRSLPPLGSNVRRGPDYVRRLRAFVRTGSVRFGLHAGAEIANANLLPVYPALVLVGLSDK